MAAGRTIGLALLGSVVGAVVGGVMGLGLGLAHTTLAETSGFEGYSGFVVAYWIIGGIFVGLLAGLIYGGRRGMG